MEVADPHQKDVCADVANVCRLRFPESGENPPIIMITAISAWSTFPNTKKHKIGKSLFIQVYLHPLRPSTMAQNCLFLNLQQRMLYHQPHWKMTMLILRLTLIIPAKILIFRIKIKKDDLSRDLGLAKAKILSCRLKMWDLLAPSCKISKPRKRHVTFANFCTMSSDSDHPSFCYCVDIQGLFQEIGIVYSASDWRLFIDSSKQSLKAVLLRNGNLYPSIVIAHSVRMKEDRESAKY